MEHNELKPCPFCGGKPLLLKTDVIFYGGSPRFFVECAVCGVSMPRIAKNKKIAMEVWNRRTNDGT